ncbi:cytochrome P450 [Trametes elegans]|nr:cytochrome P450 [Trametes elegans]
MVLLELGFLKSSSTALAVSAVILVVIAARTLWSRKIVALHLPPGPRGLPLLGNLFDMPRKEAWKTFADWSREYGDVVHLNATTDLLENRFTVYSDRPTFPLMDMVGHQFNFGFMQYGKDWRAFRRMFSSKYVSPPALQVFHASQRVTMVKLLHNILRDPEAFPEHIRLRSGQLIIDVTYGVLIESAEDPLLQIAEGVMDVTSVALSPPMWLANPSVIMQFIPKWLGGSAVSLRVQKWREELVQLRERPFRLAKEMLSKGLARPSYTTSLLQELAPAAGSEQESMIRDTAAVAYGGPPEQTIISAEVLLLVLTLHPEVQRRGQDEVDRVVGSGRLPDFVDRERLPYCTAVMKEVLRWHPPAPTGIPHMLKEDDVYKGYHMPKGSIVMGNVWNITHDEKRYPDPFTFKPERYLDPSGAFDCSTNDPSRHAFGFGRRVCPGKYFAEDSLWLAVAQILAVFSVSVPEGCLPPRVEFISGAISRPAPFKCKITPRSPGAAQLIEHAARES